MDEQPPKTQAVRRIARHDLAEDEVRRAVRELMAYFKGLRTHREALAALKTIKRFVRAQHKQNATTMVSLRSVRTQKKAKTSAA